MPCKSMYPVCDLSALCFHRHATKGAFSYYTGQRQMAGPCVPCCAAYQESGQTGENDVITARWLRIAAEIFLSEKVSFSFFNSGV